MHPKDISIADYTYDLPAEFIAHYPLAERDASRLLIYRKGVISEDIYRYLGDRLPEGALLVFNNTKVVEARIVFQKASGARIELFCLEPLPEYGGMAGAMSQAGRVRWKCLIGGASKWKAGQVLSKTIGGIVLEARYLGKLADSFLIEFSWTPAALSFAELLHGAGLIPLPPYMNRAAEPSDSERYQTIYAIHDGSVAAPTAGLHFTDAMFASLEARHIQRSFVTLHVGAGTFLPVKAGRMEQHIMHTEFIAVTAETIRELLDALAAGRPVIPVGTTSGRTVESLFWLGLKVIGEPGIGIDALVVRQWDAYAGTGGGGGGTKVGGGTDSGVGVESGSGAVGSEAALRALLGWMEERGLGQLFTTTQLLITPGYDWKIAKGLITNFHQPESTLLLLVASLIGEDWKRAYAYAMEHGFRFLSYGDGCLLLPNL